MNETTELIGLGLMVKMLAQQMAAQHLALASEQAKTKMLEQELKRLQDEQAAKE